MEAGEEIITFETYYDPMLAHIVRTRLEDNGIACFIADETMIGINPLYNNALGGIKLKILARDMHKCQEILAETESLTLAEPENFDDETQHQTICPYCNSIDVRYGNATQKRFGWLSVAVSFLLAVYPFYGRKAWHCFNCGKDFEYSL